MSKKFSREQRLRSSRQYRQIFLKSTKFVTKYFKSFVQTNNLNHARLGVIVAKRDVHSAVVRNTIKRIVRESFRANQHLLNTFDVIMLANKNCQNAKNEELRECLEKQWKKLIDVYNKA